MYDSGSQLELVAKAQLPDIFGSEGTKQTFDTRSDNKGKSYDYGAPKAEPPTPGVSRGFQHPGGLQLPRCQGLVNVSRSRS